MTPGVVAREQRPERGHARSRHHRRANRLSNDARKLDAAIEEARQKVESGRVYDAENEKVRVKWIRTLAYAVNVRRQITNDRTLEELSERIEAIEAAQEGQR